MITVEEAIEYVESNSQPGRNTVKISLKNALGFVLAEDVMSPIDMPPFRQSAMDGYAIKYNKISNLIVSHSIESANILLRMQHQRPIFGV